MTTTTASKAAFSGPFETQLSELAELMDWLWSGHGVSFVKAGDDRVFAFGGNGYVVVCDESKWNGLVELITPKGVITFKPDEQGTISVNGGTLDEKAIKEVIAEGTVALRRYYEDRYWSTPTV